MPRIVHQDVAAAPRLPCGVDELADVIHDGDIGLADDAPAPGLLDCVECLVCAVGMADVIDDHAGAFPGKAYGDALPYSGA